MSDAPPPADDSSLDLARRLRARLLPLVVLLAATMALTAPAVFLALGLYELRHQASSVAERVAGLIEREAVEDELLWQYNVPKLLGHLSAVQDEPVVTDIVVVDAGGRPIRAAAPASSSSPPAAWLWAAAPIGIDGGLGRVWVAVDTWRAYRDAGLMLAAFALVGVLLGWVIYTLPVRTATRAQETNTQLFERLEQSRGQLAELNQQLEHRVDERSTQLSAANEELEANQARLRRLSGEAILLQERERRAIARELHDAVGQALTAVRINLQLITEGGGECAETQRRAGEAVRLVDEAIEEVRRAVALLGPAIIDEIGLEAALRRQCADFAERTEIDLETDIVLGELALPPAVESTCYRVVQEALTNVARHASAACVVVSLQVAEDDLALEICDDGRGLPARGGTDAGRGLAGMRQRVYLLGGEVAVESVPEQGTAVRVRLPIRGGAEEVS